MSSRNRLAVLDARLTARKGGPHVFVLKAGAWVKVADDSSVDGGIVVVSEPAESVESRLPAKAVLPVRATRSGEDPWPVPPPPPPPVAADTADEVAKFLNEHGPWPSSKPYLTKT